MLCICFSKSCHYLYKIIFNNLNIKFYDCISFKFQISNFKFRNYAILGILVFSLCFGIIACNKQEDITTNAVENQLKLSVPRAKLVSQSVEAFKFILKSNSQNGGNPQEQLKVAMSEIFVGNEAIVNKIVDNPAISKTIELSKIQVKSSEIGTDKDLLNKYLQDQNVPVNVLSLLNSQRSLISEMRDSYKTFPSESAAIDHLKKGLKTNAVNALKSPSISEDEKQYVLVTTELQLQMIDFMSNNGNSKARTEFYDDCTDPFHCTLEALGAVLGTGAFGAGVGFSFGGVVGAIVGGAVGGIVGFLCWIFC